MLVPAALENIGEADDVAVDVGVRVDKRVAHACLRRKVYDAIEAFLCKETRNGFPVADIHLKETERRVRLQPGESIAFELWVVVSVEVVQANNFVTSIEQRLRDVHANEPGSAGNEDLHGALR